MGLRPLGRVPPVRQHERRRLDAALPHPRSNARDLRGCFPRAVDDLRRPLTDGAVQIDSGKCVGCYTCILSCPYGALSTSSEGAIQKCELCAKNAFGQPMCVQGCPNKAIVYEER